MTVQRLHIMQASLQSSDSPAQISADLETAFDRKPDVIGFTEVTIGGTGRRPLLTQVANAHGYIVRGGAGSTAVATRHPIAHHGSIRVHGGWGGAFPHGPRHIDWLAFRFGDELVYHHEAHWVTRALLDSFRKRRHTAMTAALIKQVQGHGTGRRLSFFGGDVNIDEATDLGRDRALPDWMFDRAGLTTIWDELNRFPDTIGRKTLDIIGSLDADARVRAESVRVWPLGHGDHRHVSAWYTIRD